MFFFFKETILKPTNILPIEQQRERERQRLREEDERRKKFLPRKEYQQTAAIPLVPKFEPLAVDNNNDESHTNKSKTPTTGTGTFSPNFPLTSGGTAKTLNKPSSITPLSQANVTTNHDENDPNSNETTTGAGTTAPPKKFVIKKRSTILVKLIFTMLYLCFHVRLYSIILHLSLPISMSLVRKWVMEILLSYIVPNYVVPIVNMQLK